MYRVDFDHADRSTAWFRIRIQNVYIDADSGGLRGLQDVDSGTRGDAFAALQFPMHSGQIFGLLGRTIICISGLLTAVLSLTGVVIWWKKRKARVQRSAKTYEK